MSRAAELGVRGVAMPTNGNAGAAWAAYAARAGMRSLIAMPVSAPVINRVECVGAGAELYLVDGLIGDAGRLINAAVAERDGYQEVSTLKEPYRIEGKKTMGYEIAEQLGWRLPDVILYPAGGGVGLIGIYKAMLETARAGLDGRRAAAAGRRAGDGCAADRAGVRGRRGGERAVGGRRTRSRSASPCPRRWVTSWCWRRCATPAARRSRSPTRVAREQARSPRTEGASSAPRARPASPRRPAAGVGWLAEAEQVVVLNTGTGLKYPDTVSVEVPVLARDGRVPRRA